MYFICQVNAEVAVRDMLTHIAQATKVYICSLFSLYSATVKPVYNGHCISKSPLYNSQVTESQMGLQCAFQPALTSHLSVTASFLDPKGDHNRQVSLYVQCTHHEYYVSYDMSMHV